MEELSDRKIGILLNWKPEGFDLRIAFDVIKREGKYAWGTGAVRLIPKDGKLPEGKILGLLKTSGQDYILYGFKVDISKEFRGYLNSPEKISVKNKHKKYRFLCPDLKSKAFLFLSEGFVLDVPLKVCNIKKINGNPLSSGDRSAVFIDLSNLDVDELLSKKKMVLHFSTIH